MLAKDIAQMGRLWLDASAGSAEETGSAAGCTSTGHHVTWHAEHDALVEAVDAFMEGGRLDAVHEIFGDVESAARTPSWNIGLCGEVT